MSRARLQTEDHDYVRKLGNKTENQDKHHSVDMVYKVDD